MKFWYPTLLVVLISTSATAVEDLRGTGRSRGHTCRGRRKPRFNGKPVLTIQENGKSLAVVGLALSIEPGDYTLESNGQNPFHSFS